MSLSQTAHRPPPRAGAFPEPTDRKFHCPPQGREEPNCLLYRLRGHSCLLSEYVRPCSFYFLAILPIVQVGGYSIFTTLLLRRQTQTISGFLLRCFKGNCRWLKFTRRGRYWNLCLVEIGLGSRLQLRESPDASFLLARRQQR